MKKIISAALVAVLALSNVAFASCMVNGQADATAMDSASCTAKGGTWTDANAAAPAAKTN